MKEIKLLNLYNKTIIISKRYMHKYKHTEGAALNDFRQTIFGPCYTNLNVSNITN